MNKPKAPSPPSDQPERQRALDSGRSILVQAPAGSGKTDLLTRRFLRLLAEVDEPGQIVAITFTNAAAAEMRHRILGELETAAESGGTAERAGDEFSMDSLANRALERSRALGWKLLDLPAQLRICTIDSFCRDLALQQPLLSGLAGGLSIFEQPKELYRRAARETLRKIDEAGSPLASAIEELLLWRDNNWQEMEELLVEMLASRDRWMHGFLLTREPDWTALRKQLERPFARAVRDALTGISQLLDQLPGVREEALELARFACEQSGGQLYRELAELAEFPAAPFSGNEALEELRQTHANLAELLLIGEGKFRKQVDKRLGFPADRKCEKARLLDLIAALSAIPGLEAALAAVRNLPPARYTEEDWQIVRACFALLRQAAGELQIVFAEAGAVDFIEVAQIAQRVLRGDDGLPTDAALGVSDGIRHLLVDEFQDTSRRQHQLLASLIAAWPERTGRTCFVVGDPMQSIYSFRDADAELFPRVKAVGLEIPSPDPFGAEALLFEPIQLSSNFRTAPTLVKRLNEVFVEVFAANDSSSVSFSPAQPALEDAASAGPPFSLHLKFVPQAGRGNTDNPLPNAQFFHLHRNPHGVVIPPWVVFGKTAKDNGTQHSFANSDAATEREATREEQIEEIVALIRSQMNRIEQARARGEKFRVAVLGRARSALAPIAEALRQAKIPFRAVELEKLAARPEILDALALAHALFNPQDRVAWLGVMRAPWCGLSLEELHTLAGGPELHTRPVSELLAERLPLLSEASRPAAARVLEALAAARTIHSLQPAMSMGSWLEQVWLRLGGAACVDATARANLNLLWSCLDRLPGGEADLFGSSLDAALDKLTALPDSEASGDCGVQLMTIHKSKGLEFEVVIVPELQAASGRGKPKMLSWSERGLAQPDESGEITEFLIAPFQRKGEDRGKAKAWVDQVYRERESQETRRILYVATTRAREQLHLFARPACKEEDGSFSMVEPSGSLLATAWPALEEEVRARFEEWKTVRAASEADEGQEIESIAASGESNLVVMPASAKPTLLRRLPPDYQSAFDTTSTPGAPPSPIRVFGKSVKVRDNGLQPARLYARHEGGLLSRALGSAVHALLEKLARLRENLDWDAARTALPHFEPRIAAQARAIGVDQAQAAQIAAQALQLTLNASHDPIGAWILSPHLSAASEAAWAGVLTGGLRTVRVDRVFRAGPTPCSDGEDCWWIIDYKTAHAENVDPATTLPELRKFFAPQIEAYAGLLRNLHGGDIPIRAGLYYPRILLLDWWEF